MSHLGSIIIIVLVMDFLMRVFAKIAVYAQQVDDDSKQGRRCAALADSWRFTGCGKLT